MATAERASLEEMQQAGIPPSLRDSCCKILIKLNKCRQDNFYAPWKCNDERHEYERCQYEEYMRRVEKWKQMKKDGSA
eukprot:CAMPEP_0175819706 /NCGR_PEP_ID=MMETSP0107_2-20121207/8210_1 /TAXON_ID=195067 ORGANISM="Goniomonas pacifica, Strain CCMP1869" /NCGR_SAMPLE_ID=MMETSP0107_2 /ASSEMBLY_ACC=CAM_ASM_000203 /LENGTH=77 /DNA_ID=CAMNT_0017131967 /DNA_START=14 /DNA_END=247 /DNA_ORIENTATION=+